MLVLYLGTSSFILWLIIALLPWRPWSTRERLNADPSIQLDLSDITVLIPARNEANIISKTLTAIVNQANDIPIIVVDDQSTDATRQTIEASSNKQVTIIRGKPTATGWSGKLYALEQGRQLINTPYTLLLDADIVLEPGTLATLKKKLQDNDLGLLSVMGKLNMYTVWYKLLMPAFIYFFKLLYPFHLSNKKTSRIAAAAGGCILLRTDILNKIGGFTAIKDALIDDCSLANSVKQHGYTTWTGLTHSAVSLRSYNHLSSIWLMVTRTAFTQLHYSYLLLMFCLALMLLAYVIPVMGIIFFSSLPQMLSVISLLILLLLYLPTLVFYGVNPLWCITMPLAAVLYMIMTLDSAAKHCFGTG